VRFGDDGRLDPGAVIWATGFALDRLPMFGDDGRLVHQRGVRVAPGLYSLGLPWQHTRGSALLSWVKDDAEHVAEQIATFAGTSATPSAAVLAGGPSPG
jgi:putative flavoprotein involved in K+ transport